MPWVNGTSVEKMKPISQGVIEIWKKTGKVTVMRSSGRCMVPLFDDGTPLVVRHVEPQKIRVGDIAVFRVGSMTMAHRIIGKFEKEGRLYFREKRDSGFLPGVITQDAVIGKVIGINREGDGIDLESGLWRSANRFIGHYWSFLFALYDRFIGLKKRMMKERKIPLAVGIYSWISSLSIGAANLFISLLRRLSHKKS